MKPISPGFKLGRYVVEEQIGKGGVAQVFKAADPELGRAIALKVLELERDDDVAFFERFQNEAQTIAKLDHPNILPVYDFGNDKGFAYIVTKYASGGTLNDRMGHRMSPDTIVSLLSPVAVGLDYAHELGVVHRDIKPENILFDAEENPVLCDFGISVVLNSGARLTREGRIVGTPQYISPEQVLGKGRDPRADVYSLGVLLYELLFARPPFGGGHQMATLQAHIHDPVALPDDAEPWHDRLMAPILLKALAKDPDQRHQTAGQLVGEVRTASARMASASAFPAIGAAGGRQLVQSEPVRPKKGEKSTGRRLLQQENSRATRVFLIDAHRVVREGLPTLLEFNGAVEVVGSAATAEEALTSLEAINCDLVVTDINLPGISGIEATTRIKSRFPQTKVLILSGYGESYLNDAIRAGADGYLMKSSAAQRVREAIADIQAGGTAIDTLLIKALFNRATNTKADSRHTVADNALGYAS